MKKQLTQKVSVILPLYNSREYLATTIESILAQSHPHFELIIVDDASTDGSYQLARTFADSDPRIKLSRNRTNQGVSITMNRAIQLATGNYVAIMNSDDLMMTDRLEKQLAFLEANRDHVAVGSQVRLINQHGHDRGEKNFPLSHLAIYDSIYFNNPIQHSSMMINRLRLSNSFSWYDGRMRLSEDLDLLFRLFRYGKVANHPDTLIQYRIHDQSLSQRSPKKMYYLAYKARVRGRKVHGYKTTFRNRLMLDLSMAAIMLIPSKLIFPLFYLIRGQLLKLR